jgi:prepilin-type N-terminal cleavage/methylation domain-containing protein
MESPTKRPFTLGFRERNGFTLIELLVVVAIIALLASVILVAVNNARAKGRDAARVANIYQLGQAFELFYNTNYSYPTTTTSGALSGQNAITAMMVPNYMSKMPATILPADGASCGTSGNSSNDYYMYANVAGAQYTTNTYVITFCIGSQEGVLAPGPHTLTQAGFQ